MCGAFVFVYLFLLQAQTWGLALPKKEIVVYPILLEGRDADGRKALKITDDLTLNLESSSIFSNNFLLIATDDDGRIVKGYENAGDYEENLYHDNEKLASLMVTPDAGAIKVDGIIGEKLRIKPLLGSERSSEGHIAHLLSTIVMKKPFIAEASERSENSNNSGNEEQGDGTSTAVPTGSGYHEANGSASDYADPPTTSHTEGNTTTSDYGDGNSTAAPTGNGYHEAGSSTLDYADPPTTNHTEGNTITSDYGDGTSTATPTVNGCQEASSSAPDYADAPTTSHTEGNTTTKDYAVLEERADNIMYVETHMVVETTHAKWFGYNEKKILTYLAIIGNAVNLRYKQITNPRVKIVLVGVTIQRGNEPYLKRVDSYSNMIKPMDTVMALAEYIKERKDYKKADFVMLITSLDIGSFKGDATAGFTMMGTVCGEYRTGSFEDDPESYSATYIFAHELAHGLGVVHDGSGPDNMIENHPGAYSCSSSTGYIMGDFSFDEHHYQFSTCSVYQIQHTYRLTKKYKCLHVKNTVNRIPSTSKFPGDVVPYNLLCKIGLKHLEGKYFYDQEKGVTDCNVNCKTRQGSDGYTYYSTVGALDGSACDSKNSKMACFNGRCIDSAEYRKKLVKKTKKAKKTKNTKKKL
ncbi:uncharacterized protein LOC135373191 isoform X2 [Ornithodoros turicata]|uniref:uncharacterized protein LOC135373191 isoform X2 n=1 Tax=Ornithodoros turicata TaxID=34597 RepID=UPI00313864D0